MVERLNNSIPGWLKVVEVIDGRIGVCIMGGWSYGNEFLCMDGGITINLYEFQNSNA